jgi:hypothetical protein
VLWLVANCLYVIHFRSVILAELPKNLKIENELVRYESTDSQIKNTVSISRSFEPTFDSVVCTAETYKRLQEALRLIQKI